MTEIKLEKRFPHIPDEDVTRIFQDGYMKGWEDARKKAIPIEWILKWACEFIDPNSEGYKMAMELVHDWRKENEENI